MKEVVKEYVILLPMFIQLIGLTVLVIFDKFIVKKQRNLMLVIIACDSLLVFQNIAEYVLMIEIEMPFIRTLVSILAYCLRPVILVLFIKLVAVNQKHIAAWVLVGINTAIYLTAIFSPVVFNITENNHFVRRPLGYTAFIVCAVLLAYLIVCTVREHRDRKSSLAVTLLIASVIVIFSLLEISPIYFDYPVNFITIAVVNCSMFYYIWLHLEYERQNRNALMAEQRIKIMMSQIQPHFLYNTLSTIQALCISDPSAAHEITGKFGKYLRQNLSSLEEAELIPFDKEMEHTRIYSEIEGVRFPNITVEYNIEYSDFKLPALTVQPLVENAIRHGVRNREHGIVEVNAAKSGNNIEIKIRDNGKGFDVDSINMSGEHIGIRNVKERLEKLCGGELIVESRIDEGSEITIRIPKNSGDRR